NREVGAGRRGPHYVVMSPECAAEWRQHITNGDLEEVCRNSTRPGGHEKPLVLMRTRPRTETRNAAPREQAVDCECSAQRGDPRSQPGGADRRPSDGVAGVFEDARAAVRDSACR